MPRRWSCKMTNMAAPRITRFNVGEAKAPFSELVRKGLAGWMAPDFDETPRDFDDHLSDHRLRRFDLQAVWRQSNL